jgi:hypothetical protein
VVQEENLRMVPMLIAIMGTKTILKVIDSSLVYSKIF